MPRGEGYATKMLLSLDFTAVTEGVSPQSSQIRVALNDSRYLCGQPVAAPVVGHSRHQSPEIVSLFG